VTTMQPYPRFHVRPRHTLLPLTLALTVAWCLVAVGCAPAGNPKPPNAIVIGALLPFTGADAASGIDIERGILLAVDRINAAGGIEGRPLYTAFADTHSAEATGIEEADKLIAEKGISLLLGPDEEGLAVDLEPLLAQADILQISAGMAPPLVVASPNEVRVSLASTEVGWVLAQRIVGTDKHRSVAVLYENNVESNGLVAALMSRVTGCLGSIAVSVPFEPGKATYLLEVQQIQASGADAIVLVAEPTDGATIARNWVSSGDASSGEAFQWYLSPRLRSDVLLRNSPNALFNGAIGISPDVSDGAGAFAADFAQAWDGDVPLTQSYYYYDATMLAALGMQAAVARNGHQYPPSFAEARAAILDVSRATTFFNTAYWYDTAAALALARSGAVFIYSAVSGARNIDDQGRIRQGFIEFWTVQGREFSAIGAAQKVNVEELASTQCKALNP
jgi:ABC-type branched-subunit amino acid transport system substrate-binding protein